MLDKDRDVQGVGAYFELKPQNTTRSTFQLILLPEGYTETLQRVSPTAFHRSVHTYAPRKSWRRTVIRMETIDYSNPETIAKAIEGFLYSASIGSYTQVAETLLFEVSKADLTVIAKGKLPPRINNKIKTMRQSHGYPEAVIELKEEASA